MCCAHQLNKIRFTVKYALGIIISSKEQENLLLGTIISMDFTFEQQFWVSLIEETKKNKEKSRKEDITTQPNTITARMNVIAYKMRFGVHSRHNKKKKIKGKNRQKNTHTHTRTKEIKRNLISVKQTVCLVVSCLVLNTKIQWELCSSIGTLYQ